MVKNILIVIAILLACIGFNKFKKSSTTNTITIDDLEKNIQGISIESAFWDDISLSIFFSNNYQISIPYHWEIYERNSNSDEPILAKINTTLENNADHEINECKILWEEKLVDIGVMDSALIFGFENLLLIIHIDDLGDDGKTLIGISDPAKKVFALRIEFIEDSSE